MKNKKNKKAEPDQHDLELQVKHRPATLDGVIGQEDAKEILSSLLENKKVPHSLLFSGPSGCGKTTLARIVANELGCVGIDFQEINAAEERGIETIRKIQSTMDFAPMLGRVRVFLLDEAHRLTNDAQAAMLKILEDAPKRAYFMLATTDPQKLLPTVLSRCTEITVRGIDEDDLRKLIRRVAKREGIDLSPAVLDRLIECAGGSGREAVKSLGRIASIKNEKKRLNAIQPTGVRAAAEFIGLFLMEYKKGSWSDVAKVIQRIEDSEIEGVRRGVLGMAVSAAIGGKDKKGEYKNPPQKPHRKSLLVIEAFKEHFFDSGRAGIVSACWEVMQA